MKGISEEETQFKKYRDLAPESLNDESLKELISEYNLNEQQIVEALTNIWNGQHSSSSSSSAWTSTKKNKKSIPNETVAANHRKSGGQPVSNHTNGSKPSSKEKKAKTSTLDKTPRKQSDQPPIVTDNKLAIRTKPKNTTEILKDENTTPKTNASSNGGGGQQSAWAENLVQKLKQKDSQPHQKNSIKSKVEIAPISSNIIPEDDFIKEDNEEIHTFSEIIPTIQETITDIGGIHNSTIDYTVDDEEKENLTSEDMKFVSEDEILSFGNLAIESNSTVRDHDEKPGEAVRGLLNLGKWDSSSDKIDGGAFQFGSFGIEETSASIQSTSWTGSSNVNELSNEQSSVNWNSTNSLARVDLKQSMTSSSLTSLFPSETKSLAPSHDTLVNATRIDHKPQAPPGLDNGSQVKAMIAPNPPQQVKSPPSQSSRKPDQPSSYPTQTFQYNQPPGIPFASGRGTVTQTPFYQTGFDITSSQQYMSAYNVAPVANVSASTPSASTTPAVITSAGTTSTSSQPAPQQPTQQFAGPPGISYGYYPNPYYPNQAAYYYPQANVAGFYGQQQGRNVYSNQRGNYQSDPYSSNGSGYPDSYGTSQFAETSSPYGTIPIHPTLPQMAGPSSVNAASAGSVANTKQKVNTVSSQATADISTGYAYNSYGTRGTDQSWYQNQNPGWGNMIFPGSAPQSTGNVLPNQVSGFAPQSQTPQQQSSRDGQRSNPNISSYSAPMNSRPTSNPSNPVTGHNNWLGSA